MTKCETRILEIVDRKLLLRLSTACEVIHARGGGDTCRAVFWQLIVKNKVDVEDAEESVVGLVYERDERVRE